MTIHEALTRYITIRRCLGSQLREQAKTLGHFVDLLEREGMDFITTDIAVRWAQESHGVQRATWSRRLSMVRQFAAWLHPFDLRTEVPPKRLLYARHRRNKPYIFTNEEIERRMAEASRLPSPKGLRAPTYVTLIGLLASCGLRPGEALALDSGDVDLQNGILAVRCTKFGKSRFVPIGDTTRAALVRYAEIRGGRRPPTTAFLVSEKGTRLGKCAARRTFAKVSCAVGLRAPTGSRLIGRVPRLQDMRHTFATRKLVEWYKEGLDVTRELPKLSTYLGHVEVSHTYWYIEAVPELLNLATERASREGTR